MRSIIWLLAGAALLLEARFLQAATTNSWINPGSSSWGTAANWSAAQAPSTSFDYIVIANAGSKTVTIDASTPPASLSIRHGVVSAPAGTINTLLFTNVPSSAPFTTSLSFFVDAGGMLVVTNSTLALGDRLDISGVLVLESGLVDTAASSWDMRVGRTAGATGIVSLNGGVLSCFGFRAGTLGGSAALCNITNGMLLSSSVLSLGEVRNSPGTLNLRGGHLIATNDLTKVGNLAYGEFNQSAGTSEMAFLSIGDNMPGTLNMSGGRLTVTPNAPTDIARVGNFGDSQLNVSGGVVQFKGEFHVADNPGVNGTVLLSGGELISTNATVAIGRYGIGTMSVTNSTAWFTNTSVGRHTGASGTLNVQTGGTVFCVDDLSVGRFTNAVGLVSVSGGLLSLTNDNIWAGREGMGTLDVLGGNIRARGLWVGMSPDGTNTPQGTLNLSGGTVLLSSNLIVGTALVSTGQVSVVGGNLVITNTAGSGLLNVVNGTFAISQGTARADRLLLTNTAGQVTFSGGDMEVRDMTVANGSPFVAGDGVTPTTLRLSGGTWTFADGLVISANATLTGCGTIIGTIINSGTIATNCGGSQNVTIATSSSPANGGTTGGSGSYTSGASVTLTATPTAGFVFVNWTEGGAPVSSSASYTFTATANRTLVANFAQTFTIATSSSPANGGTTSGGGGYTSGASVTLTATPTAGFVFVNWTEGGAPVSSSASYTFTATANRTLVANFVPASGFLITVERTGNVTSVSFVSTVGLTYVLEYKNTLNDANWTPLVPGSPGTGARMTLQDPNATPPTRFYRVHAQ